MPILSRGAVAAMVLSVVALPGAGSAQSVSEGIGCLPGNWYLDNTDLFLSIEAGLSAMQSGTDFDLQEISGDYLATINPDDGTVVIAWQDWTMRGVASTARSGVFPVVMRLDGNQYYNIAELTETSMSLALTRDAMNATVTFAGQTIPNATAMIPPFAGGTWTCAVDALTVMAEGRNWSFERADF